MSTPTCGTHGGYQRHGRRDEEPCDPCKAAHAAYQAAWRSRNVTDWRGGRRATSKAQARLAAAHPEEYRRIYADELGKQREVS